MFIAIPLLPLLWRLAYVSVTGGFGGIITLLLSISTYYDVQASWSVWNFACTSFLKCTCLLGALRCRQL